MSDLIGWKEIAAYIGVHVRTAIRWHSTVKPMPIIKVGKNNASVRVERNALRAWKASFNRAIAQK